MMPTAGKCSAITVMIIILLNPISCNNNVLASLCFHHYSFLFLTPHKEMCPLYIDSSFSLGKFEAVEGVSAYSRVFFIEKKFLSKLKQ